jgi:hypothetical protein
VQSATPAQVLDGGNLIAVQQPDGSWELIQFLTATPIGERQVALTGLLRGQFGTQGNELVPAGSPIVLVDEALVPTARDLDDIGRPVQWRVGPASVDVGDAAMAALSQAPTSTTYLPYAPVHARVRREAAGLRITFVRRTRVGGDGWQPGEVPLGEEREAYEVDILAAGAVKRTLRADTPAVLYPAADELADFGAPQTVVSLRIFQMSATVGRGRPAEGTFHV